MLWWFLKKLNIDLPHTPAIPLLGTCPKEWKAETQTGICTKSFLAAPFTVTERGDNSSIPRRNGQTCCMPASRLCSGLNEEEEVLTVLPLSAWTLKTLRREQQARHKKTDTKWLIQSGQILRDREESRGGQVGRGLGVFKWAESGGMKTLWGRTALMIAGQWECTHCHWTTHLKMLKWQTWYIMYISSQQKCYTTSPCPSRPLPVSPQSLLLPHPGSPGPSSFSFQQLRHPSCLASDPCTCLCLHQEHSSSVLCRDKST